jgi:acetone carboxylase gamma subunit
MKMDSKAISEIAEVYWRDWFEQRLREFVCPDCGYSKQYGHAK